VWHWRIHFFYSGSVIFPDNWSLVAFNTFWEAGRPEGFCPRAATELSEQSNARFASADLLCFFIDLRSDWIYGASQPPSIFLLPVYSPTGWL